MNPMTTTQIITASDEGLFEQIDADGTRRCTVCGAVDMILTGSYPGFVGEETTLTCAVCFSVERDSDPFKGTRLVERHDGAEVVLADRPDKMIARGGFLYPLPADGYQYPTDPATLVDVRPGIRVAMSRPDLDQAAQTFTVIHVGRDEFGVYLRGERWDNRGYYNLAPYAASTVHAITIVAG